MLRRGAKTLYVKTGGGGGDAKDLCVKTGNKYEIESCFSSPEDIGKCSYYVRAKLTMRSAFPVPV